MEPATDACAASTGLRVHVDLECHRWLGPHMHAAGSLMQCASAMLVLGRLCRPQLPVIMASEALKVCSGTEACGCHSVQPHRKKRSVPPHAVPSLTI